MRGTATNVEGIFSYKDNLMISHAVRTGNTIHTGRLISPIKWEAPQRRVPSIGASRDNPSLSPFLARPACPELVEGIVETVIKQSLRTLLAYLAPKG